MSLEVLAPVGNEESLKAAVFSGADAVYFGADKFNARRNANNFKDLELEKAIKYSKSNGVKAYLTLNILIKNDEIKAALELVNKAYSAGIDAIIVQDLGLANLIHKNFPTLALHASTQMSVMSPSAIPLIKSLGFSRVVVAREMSDTQLENFMTVANEYGLEVEVFVHGALCMSVSGDCYFSAFLGGRSANRGLCAGTCRLPFSAKGDENYALSLKDLSLVKHLQKLKKLGVASFKIEGRMKRPEYVAQAVYTIKEALKNNKADEKQLNLLKNIFSRSGFTDGYFTGKLGKEMFGVRSEEDKISSNEVLKSIHEIYRRPIARIPVDFSVDIKLSEPLKLTANSKGHTVCIVGEKAERAINKPLNQEKIYEAISTLGNTAFYCNNLKLNLDDNLALPISKIKDARNKAIEKLIDFLTLAKQPAKIFVPTLEASYKKPKGLFVRLASIKQLKALETANIMPMGFSLPIEVVTEYTSLSQISKLCQDENIIFSAELPRASLSQDKLNNMLLKAKELGVNTLTVSNIADIYLAKNMGFNIMGGFGLNIMNNYSAKLFYDLGLFGGVISTELSFEETHDMHFKGFKTFAFSYGHQPLMLTRNCPVKSEVGCKDSPNCKLVDRKNESFRVVCRNEFTEILNSRPTDIADMQNKVSADFLYLHFTFESDTDTIEVCNRFLNSKKTNIPFTRGLYNKGVL